MLPTLENGRFVTYGKAHLADLSIGDIIIFKDLHTGERICHRVIEVHVGFVKTKGDANRFPDRVLVTDKNLIGKVVQVDNH